MDDDAGNYMAARMMARHACATGQDVAEVFELEAPTPEELRLRAIAADKIKKEELRAAAVAAAPSSHHFQLAGSKRAADDSNQRSLF